MLEWFKSKLRQLEQRQERVHPEGIRGRVFSMDDDTVPGRAQASTKPKVVLKMKVTRTDGSVENYTADATQIEQERA